MEDLDSKVQEALEKIGFITDRIPRGSGNSADFKFEIEGVSSIIEVKTMNDTPEFCGEYISLLKSGEAFEFVGEKDTRKNIKKAFIQVDASYKALNANGFKSIGIYSNAMNAFVDMNRRIYDFYGICDFFCFKGLSPILTQCLGFYKSIFDIYMDIDFVVLISDFSKNILINEHSPRFDILSTSKTLSLFEKSNEWNVINPASMVNGGRVISLNNRELAVTNPGNIFGGVLSEHESSTAVIEAKKELCRIYGFSEMLMESNRGRSFVIGH